MSAVIVIQSTGVGAGGGDIIPDAVDWTNLTVTSGSGIEATNEITFAGLSSPITVRAAWTSTSGSPTQAQWVKNGVSVSSPALTSIDATIINGDKLKWKTYAGYTHPSGNYDTGTVTVTNETKTATVTTTIASPCEVGWTGHGLIASTKVRFSTTGALPTGLTAGTIYYVLAAGLGADLFQVSATDGGAAINTSGTQSGTHTAVMVLDTFTFACQYVRTGGGGGGGGGSYSEPPEIN